MEDMLKKLIMDLADNYHENDDRVLSALLDYYSNIASSTSHRKKDDELIQPYIYLAVKSAFIRRGDEGTSSSNEGGLSSNYIDIEEKLRKDCRSVRVIK